MNSDRNFDIRNYIDDLEAHPKKRNTYKCPNCDEFKLKISPSGSKYNCWGCEETAAIARILTEPEREQRRRERDLTVTSKPKIKPKATQLRGANQNSTSLDTNSTKACARPPATGHTAISSTPNLANQTTSGKVENRSEPAIKPAITNQPEETATNQQPGESAADHQPGEPAINSTITNQPEETAINQQPSEPATNHQPEETAINSTITNQSEETAINSTITNQPEETAIHSAITNHPEETAAVHQSEETAIHSTITNGQQNPSIILDSKELWPAHFGHLIKEGFAGEQIEKWIADGGTFTRYISDILDKRDI